MIKSVLDILFVLFNQLSIYDQTKLWAKALTASLVNYKTDFIGLDFYTATAKSVKTKEKISTPAHNLCLYYRLHLAKQLYIKYIYISVLQSEMEIRSN